MAFKRIKFFFRDKYLLLGLVLCFMFIWLLAFSPIQDTSLCAKDTMPIRCVDMAKRCKISVPGGFDHDHVHKQSGDVLQNVLDSISEKKLNITTNHKLALIVPFRDRFEELMEFAPYMTKYLTRKGINFHIYVINQVDNYRFNRASLVNIGFLESKASCDYIGMHDVDLLPLNPDLNYSYPELGPFHVAAPGLHPKYDYDKFIGGILLIKNQDYIKVNGMSNKYYGWGREDDELYVRFKVAGLKIYRPQGLKTGKKDTFLHVHNGRNRPRDSKSYFDQRTKTNRLDRDTGLSNVKFQVDERHHLIIDGATITCINVRLKCDVNVTPWCLKAEDHGILKKSDQSKKIA